MEIILISSQIDTSTNILKTIVGTPIAIITASVTTHNKENLRQVVSSYNGKIRLKLVDENGITKQYLKGSTEAHARNGVALFLTCSITKPGNWILVAETSEEQTPSIKDGLLLTTISYNLLSLYVKYKTFTDKILPNIPYVYEMIIVDTYDNKVEFTGRETIPTLKMAINQMPDIVDLATGEKVPSFDLEADEDNVYKFIFTAKKAGDYYIYINAYDTKAKLRNNNVQSSFKIIDVIFNNKGIGCVVPHLNYQFSNGISSSSHLAKKEYLINKTHENRKVNRTVPFETGLTSSQRLSYKIKNPQENNSLPIKIDKSFSNELSQGQAFNPRIRAPFPKKLNTQQTLSYDLTASGLTSASLTNMHKTYVEQSGPNAFVLPNTLRMSDLLTRNKNKATIENKYITKLDAFKINLP
jgi:hypothetical protein